MIRKPAVAAIVTVCLFGARASGASVHEEPAEVRLLELVNAHRAEHGTAPLMPSPRLRGVARERAERMAEAGTIFHAQGLREAADAALPEAGAVAENVGVAGDADTLAQVLLGSPEHHANIDDRGLTLCGVGAVRGPDGSLYVSHVFAAVRDRPAVVPLASRTRALRTPVPVAAAPVVWPASTPAVSPVPSPAASLGAARVDEVPARVAVPRVREAGFLRRFAAAVGRLILVVL